MEQKNLMLSHLEFPIREWLKKCPNNIENIKQSLINFNDNSKDFYSLLDNAINVILHCEAVLNDEAKLQDEEYVHDLYNEFFRLVSVIADQPDITLEEIKIISAKRRIDGTYLPNYLPKFQKEPPFIPLQAYQEANDEVDPELREKKKSFLLKSEQSLRQRFLRQRFKVASLTVYLLNQKSRYEENKNEIDTKITEKIDSLKLKNLKEPLPNTTVKLDTKIATEDDLISFLEKIEIFLQENLPSEVISPQAKEAITNEITMVKARIKEVISYIKEERDSDKKDLYILEALVYIQEKVRLALNQNLSEVNTKIAEKIHFLQLKNKYYLKEPLPKTIAKLKTKVVIVTEDDLIPLLGKIEIFLQESLANEMISPQAKEAITNEIVAIKARIEDAISYIKGERDSDKKNLYILEVLAYMQKKMRLALKQNLKISVKEPSEITDATVAEIHHNKEIRTHILNMFGQVHPNLLRFYETYRQHHSIPANVDGVLALIDKVGEYLINTLEERGTFLTEEGRVVKEQIENFIKDDTQFYLDRIDRIKGYTIKLAYNGLPKEEAIQSNELYLYLVNNKLFFITKTSSGKLTQKEITYLKNGQLQIIKSLLQDPLKKNQLDIQNIEAIFDFTGKDFPKRKNSLERKAYIRAFLKKFHRRLTEGVENSIGSSSIIKTGIWNLIESAYPNFLKSKNLEELEDYFEADENPNFAVKYFGFEDREKYRIHIYGQKFVRLERDDQKIAFKPLTTFKNASHEKKGWVAIVMNSKGEIFGASHYNSVVLHSSFMNGAPVVFAGEMRVEKGTVLAISTYSGHYNPKFSDLKKFVQHLHGKNVDLSKCQFYAFDYGKYFADEAKISQLEKEGVKRDKIDRLRSELDTNSEKLKYSTSYRFVKGNLVVNQPVDIVKILKITGLALLFLLGVGLLVTTIIASHGLAIPLFVGLSQIPAWGTGLIIAGEVITTTILPLIGVAKLTGHLQKMVAGVRSLFNKAREWFKRLPWKTKPGQENMTKDPHNPKPKNKEIAKSSFSKIDSGDPLRVIRSTHGKLERTKFSYKKTETAPPPPPPPKYIPSAGREIEIEIPTRRSAEIQERFKIYVKNVDDNYSKEDAQYGAIWNVPGKREDYLAWSEFVKTIYQNAFHEPPNYKIIVKFVADTLAAFERSAGKSPLPSSFSIWNEDNLHHLFLDIANIHLRNFQYYGGLEKLENIVFAGVNKLVKEFRIGRSLHYSKTMDDYKKSRKELEARIGEEFPKCKIRPKPVLDDRIVNEQSTFYQV